MHLDGFQILVLKSRDGGVWYGEKKIDWKKY